MKIITTENASASQTEHPWRATLRTFIQSVLGALVALGAIFLLVPDAMDELAEALEGVGIVVPAVLIALPPVIARIMAIPGVEKALRGISLGAAPTEREHFGHGSEEVVDHAAFDDLSSPDPFPLDDDEGDADPEGPPDGETEEAPEVLEDDEGDADPEGLSVLEAAAAAEVDTTPVPEDYEPRH